MSKSGGDNNGRKGRRQNGTGSDNGKFGKQSQSQSNQRKSARNKRSNTKGTSAGFSKTTQTSSSSSNSRKDAEYQERITQLEALAASQAVELRKLRVECDKLKEAAETFNEVVNLLRKAGLQTDDTKSASTSDKNGADDDADDDADAKSKGKNGVQENSIQSVNSQKGKNPKAIMAYEAFDDSEIFGTAPRSVTDAADAAGTSVLAALLGGKQRMLVDVRDAELSRDLDILAQFIELSILPVAAGLEGLKTKKNRVKIVFPTVSLLMQYRKSMTLAAPEVISLSTLGLDPVEERDNLVVIIAPSPDDPEGLAQMDELLESPSLRQPVVVLNHHMVPLLGPGGQFEPVYHLRLLSVQYMTGESPPPEWDRRARRKEVNGDNMPVDTDTDDSNDNGNAMTDVDDSNGDYDNTNANANANANNTKDIVSGGDGETQNDDDGKEGIQEDAELEAAMEHAHELGVHQGVTRAMVIRAYPRPWHIFVDTSPDSDADFEVAATFDECPTPDDVNYAIVECLEGSEREDELVAQQMQEALESGQLNTVKDMLGLPIIETDMDVAADASDESDDEDDEDDNDEDDWHTWGTDTV